MIKIENDEIKVEYNTEPQQKENAIPKDYVSKKVAALEVYKELKVNKILGFGLICSVLIVAIAAAFSRWGGSISAGVFAAFAMFFIKKSIDKMKYLEERYGLNPNAK